MRVKKISAKISVFKCFYGIYDLGLFISLRAFLPSLIVLKTSQESEKTKSIVSVIKEI